MCNKCKTTVCSCSQKASCKELTDDVQYNGTTFECKSDPKISISSGMSLTAILLFIYQKLCLLATSVLAVESSVSKIIVGHIIEDEGVPLAQRGTMNFVGDGVVVTDDGVGKTVVTINTGTGAVGPEGQAYRFGAGVPAGALGVDGDTYINLTSVDVDVYTKAAGVWTDSGVNLRGATGFAGTNGTNGADGANGADGIDGLNIYQSAAAPLVGSGVDGESHIDSVTGDLWFKAAGVWGITGNLYSGALVGVTGLFNVSRNTDMPVNGVNIPFPVTNGVGNYNYGIAWLTDEWVSPDTLNTIIKGEFLIQGDGVAGGISNTISVLVYKNNVLQSTTDLGTIVVTDTSIFTYNFITPSVAVVLGDRINVALTKTGSGTGASYVIKSDSYLFNEFN